MTFEQLVEIINDQTKTAYQKAADLHALLTKAAPTVKLPGTKQRKARGPNKPKPLLLSNGTEQNQDVN